MPTPNTTIVVGHRNPDNDAICAAVAYADLKQRLDPDVHYVPCRLGPLPDETEWILDRMGVPAPRLISHVHSRVRDAMSRDVISVQEDDIMLNAGRKMRDHDIRALVVNDAKGKYVGIVTVRKISELYIEDIDMVDTYETQTKLGDLAEAIGGRIVIGDPDTMLCGHLRVAASEPETFRGIISEGDIVVMGDRYRSQRIAIESHVSCMVLAVGAEPDEEIIELARQNGVALVCAKQDTYTVTRLATLAQPIRNYVETDPLVLDPDAILREVIPDILHSHQREGVVVDEDGKCIGIITRTDIAVLPRRKVILVDHNEKAQSVPGIDDAEILEIVDHHRVGDIQTATPIKFISLPWGSSSTIVADQYRENGVEVPREMAGVMLSAVLTDTVLLKSPTTTDFDRDVAKWLGSILDVDPIEFGIELFHRRGSEKDLSIDTMVTSDSKEFEIGDKRILIAQHETADFEEVMKRSGEIQDFIEKLQVNSNYDLVLFMLTDIINPGSQFFCAGNARIVERAFGIDLGKGSVWLDGILSRKKQVVTRLLRQG
ncbi:MAG: putative manganese-dependent inorganic diphosphatase [Coriobacteriales bacterium]|jgi:manganese-dependent inorganic pyrophosphatase